MTTTTTITTEQAEKLGNAWTHPSTGAIRYYINDPTIWGLDVDYYKSGNVSSATLDGERISNSKATELLGLKVWIEDGAVHVSGAISPKVPLTVDEIVERVVAAAQDL